MQPAKGCDPFAVKDNQMLSLLGRVIRRAVVAAILLPGLLGNLPYCRGESPDRKQTTTSYTSGYRPAAPQTPDNLAQHPLRAVIEYARREQKYLERTVQDFTCRLVKRERIGGFLQEQHFVDMQVREATYVDGRIEQPLSIYLHFLAPKSVGGRNVLYVEGQNDGKMLVRNGGKHFDYVLVKLDPNGETAREETLVPVTDIGFNRLLGKMIEVLERHQLCDPSGDNSHAEQIAGAKINQRACTVIRITHPRPMEGLEFHTANVFVDDELHVPVRVDYSDWPKTPGRPAPLIAEYTYTELRLNVKLPNSTFSTARLREP